MNTEMMKTISLSIILILIAGVIYMISQTMTATVFFIFGAVWNITYEKIKTLEVTSKKFSTSRIILFLQGAIDRWTVKLPDELKIITKSLSAYVFISAIAFINDSDVPGFYTLPGSVLIELILYFQHKFSFKFL